MSKKQLRVQVKGKWYTVEVEDLTSTRIRALVDGEPVEVEIEWDSEKGASQSKPESTPSNHLGTEVSAARIPSAVKVFHTPMSGLIVSVAIKEGDQVIVGDEVCVLEAMKMQQHLRADWSGIVKSVHVEPGQQVLTGEPIVELE